jgi:hypothetical protein
MSGLSTTDRASIINAKRPDKSTKLVLAVSRRPTYGVVFTAVHSNYIDTSDAALLKVEVFMKILRRGLPLADWPTDQTVDSHINVDSSSNPNRPPICPPLGIVRLNIGKRRGRHVRYYQLRSTTFNYSLASLAGTAYIGHRYLKPSRDPAAILPTLRPVGLSVAEYNLRTTMGKYAVPPSPP